MHLFQSQLLKHLSQWTLLQRFAITPLLKQTTLATQAVQSFMSHRSFDLASERGLSSFWMTGATASS